MHYYITFVHTGALLTFNVLILQVSDISHSAFWECVITGGIQIFFFIIKIHCFLGGKCTKHTLAEEKEEHTI